MQFFKEKSWYVLSVCSQAERIVQVGLHHKKFVEDCLFGTDFKIGDSALVCEGPLTGLRVLINRIDNKKLYIHVDTIPGLVMIDVEPHQVQLEKDTVYQLVTNRCFSRIYL